MNTFMTPNIQSERIKGDFLHKHLELKSGLDITSLIFLH